VKRQFTDCKTYMKEKGAENDQKDVKLRTRIT